MNICRSRSADGAGLRRVPLSTCIAALFTVAFSLLVIACGSDSPSSPTSTTLKVSSISPATGSTTGGNAVTITGSGFAADATVMIGGVAATNVVVSGPTSITAVTGVRSAAGAAEVTVTSGGKTASLSNGFTFIAPSGTNRPPVISGFRSVGSRSNQPSGFADIDETIQVIATVTDSETPNSGLTYEWSAPGILTPSGTTLTWKIPTSFSTGTPTTVNVGLKVTETFTENGVTHQQSTTGAFPVRVHDSQKEVMDAGEDFLVLFSDSTKTTDQVKQLMALPIAYNQTGMRAAPQASGRVSRRPYAHRTATDDRHGWRRTIRSARYMNVRRCGQRRRAQSPRHRPK